MKESISKSSFQMFVPSLSLNYEKYQTNINMTSLSQSVDTYLQKKQIVIFDQTVQIKTNTAVTYLKWNWMSKS
jgi:hypothetical protein